MKRCELCSHFAQMYCQSDNASLCYDCDQNVHSANFLVAKHSRTLLCHKCQSPTPWNASGVNLGRTASVCVNCLDEHPSQRRVLQEGDTNLRGNDVVEENCDVHDEDEDGDTDDDDTESSDESEDEDEDEDEDAENQVVPLSSAASPPATGSSSSEEFSSSRLSSDGFRSASKRERLDPCIDSEDDTPCSSEKSSSKRRTEIDDAIALGYFRPSNRIEDRGEACDCLIESSSIDSIQVEQISSFTSALKFLTLLSSYTVSRRGHWFLYPTSWSSIKRWNHQLICKIELNCESA
ncbi:unnamed protein product [Lactuca saligna]|uniref:B box-type domain-containing protein n=1 Tax=Lactuca saligna TaxID=75948 RepID=A0AA35Y924_LACSI|nr:unnamed protein product [Lactuca saligna]